MGRHVGLAPVAEPGLREMHFGVVEDTLSDAWQAYPDLMPHWRDRTDLDFGWPGGETRRQLHARVFAAMAAIVARHQPGDQVIVVSHGGPIRAYLTAVTRHPSLAEADLTRDLGNCSITHIHFARKATAWEWAACWRMIKWSICRARNEGSGIGRINGRLIPDA